MIAYSLASEDYRDSLSQYLAAIYKNIPQYENPNNSQIICTFVDSKGELIVNNATTVAELKSDICSQTGKDSVLLTLLNSADGVKIVGDALPAGLTDVTIIVPKCDEFALDSDPPNTESTGEDSNNLLNTVTLKPMTREQLEAAMLSPMKTHIKHQFADEHDGEQSRFLCRTSWAAQFHAMREVLCGMHGSGNHEQEYARSLSLAESWAATGGKSGATFSKTLDNR